VTESVTPSDRDRDVTVLRQKRVNSGNKTGFAFVHVVDACLTLRHTARRDGSGSVSSYAILVSILIMPCRTCTTDDWYFEGGEAARQQRMEEVGIDKLLHEEKHRNYFKGGEWKLKPEEIKKIELDEVACFSLCPKTHSDQITRGIVNLLEKDQLNPKQMTITDGCAGVGGVIMSLIVVTCLKK
jgi:hypothetical protein